MDRILGLHDDLLCLLISANDAATTTGSFETGYVRIGGPGNFTVAGAENAHRALSANSMGDTELAAMILKVIASWMSLGIWGLAL